MDNSEVIVFLFLNENLHCDPLLEPSQCDPSLEPSQQDGSNEGSQYMFLCRSNRNYPKIIPVTPSYLGHGEEFARMCHRASKQSLNF